MRERPFSEFRNEGLLWLVNTSVFHPRGYALAFHFEADVLGDYDNATVTGWSLMGNGEERWEYDSSGFVRPNAAELDRLYARTRRLMP